MKVCIYGAGAVGGHIAGRLAKAGADVSLVARGAHLSAIQAHGLRVETHDDVLQSRPRATDNPAELGSQDVVLVTLKAPSLPLAAEGIASLMGADTLVVFALNGIPWWYFRAHGGLLDGARLPRLDPHGDISRAIPAGQLAGAVAYTASAATAPGVIAAKNPQNRLILGRPDGAAHPQLTKLADALRAGGLDAELTHRIRDAIWSKLLVNLIGGSLGVLTGSSMREAFAAPPVSAAAAVMAREVAAVAQALGCDIGDPEAGLPRLSASTHKQSLLQDLERGRPMEVDALLRVPLDLARLAAVDTPMLDFVIGLATQRTRAAGLYLG